MRKAFFLRTKIFANINNVVLKKILEKAFKQNLILKEAAYGSHETESYDLEKASSTIMNKIAIEENIGGIKIISKNDELSFDLNFEQLEKNILQLTMCGIFPMLAPWSVNYSDDDYYYQAYVDFAKYCDLMFILVEDFEILELRAYSEY